MNRRRFLAQTGRGLLLLLDGTLEMSHASATTTTASGPITLFLCGDVMTGRGIDQALPHPVAPVLYEPYIRDARGYVTLAERASGPIARPMDFGAVWGDALQELARMAPDLRIINLETAVTKNDQPWPGKGINYRMHPENIPVIKVAAIDACVLANNHVLDWEQAGLLETLAVLEKAGLRYVGAGRNLAQAQEPLPLALGDRGRVVVFGFGTPSSGIPPDWAATGDAAGVNLLPDLSATTLERIAGQVAAVKCPGDVVVASIHWGGNWGYRISAEQRAFAYGLIEKAGVDVVHGHSSHHPKGIEVHENRLILYGCGDFINDYEGISGYEEYRGELGLMYFPRLDPASGRLEHLTLTPTRMERFRIHRANEAEAHWLQDMLNREGQALGTQVDMQDDGRLALRWQ